MRDAVNVTAPARVSSASSSAAVEQIPLVVRDSDTVAPDSRGLTLRCGQITLRFDWAQQLNPELRPASTITCPGRRMHILTVPHNGTFTLTISAS
jgi:hypothetical protein